ncbi:MAG: hypothetical protein LBU94_00920, partial [Clostridiales bacterium]|nr:hypothetical protein [Clostridiales bacterium]
MRFKRIMSMFIAALCVLNLVPAVFTTNELKAAIALNARLDANLTTSESSDTPVINYQSANLPSDTVYLSYAFPTSENKPVILSYLLDPVTKVAFELSFDEINGIYTAYYRLSKYTNGLWEQQPFSPTVYNYLEKGFLPADEYMGYTPESSKNQVIKADTDTDSSNDSDGYYFQFISGAGFGITYSGRQIFFYADALGNIHYGTNGIREGYIYNFDIIDGTNDTVLGEQSVYSGINRDTLDFIPIANGETGAIQAPAYFNTYPLRNDDTYVLDNSAGEIPAEDQVGMVIRFDEPMVLDFDTMGTPSVLSAADVDKDTNSQSDYKIDVTFDMLQNLGRPDSSVRIRVNDILRLTETETIFTDLLGDETSALFDSVEILDDENINDTSTVRFLPDTGSAGDPRRVQVTVNNLLDGMLFSNMSVTSIMYNPVNTVSEEDMALGEPPHFNAVGVSKTAGSPIPFGKAFTFLKYGFFYDGVKFSLQFTPYKGFEGNYDIYIGTESARQVPSDGTGFISVDLGVPLNDEYQVFFAPETLATGGQMDKESMVYSEVVRYDPDGADINLGAARDFRIDEYTLKPVMPTPDDEDDGSEGTLDISMSWQLGMESAIHNMWDAAQDSDLSSDEPLVVKYALNKSLTGTDGEDTAVYGYAYIDITKEPDPVTGLDEYYASFTIVDQSIGYDNFIAESFDPNNPGVPTYGTGKNELLLEAGMYRVNVDVKDIPAQRDAYNLTNVDESRFFYEKIYFLCVETLPAGIDDINKKSNFDSMSLSDVIYGTIPPVKDLQEDKPSTYRDSFKVSWVADMEQLYEYFHNSPFDSAKAEFNFNVFISQNEEEMTDLSRLTPEELSELFSAGEQAGNYFDYAGAPWVEYAIDITGEQLSLLRDDEVVRFGGLNVTEAVLDNHLSDLDNFLSNLTVNGLDENQTYYVYVNFEVTHNDITDEDLDKTRSSILSSLIGITTKGEPKPPDGGDKRPGAPDVMIRDVTTDSATVYWNFTTIPEEDSTDKVYYEIVRTTGEQIPMKFVDSYIAFPDLYDQLIDGMGNDAGIVVLQTPEDNMGSELTVVHGSNVNASDFEIIFTTNGPEIRDKSLTSNEI